MATFEHHLFEWTESCILCLIANAYLLVQRTFDLNFNSETRRDHGENFLRVARR